MMKSKLIGNMLVGLCLASVLTIHASAEYYSFGGAESAEYYPATGVGSVGGTSADNAPSYPIIYTPALFTCTDGMQLGDGSIGTVRIPSLGIDLKVWPGATDESMAKGLGHYASTSGWDGNVGLCGHNRGSPFAIGSIKDLRAGDVITYTTIYGTRTYEVSFVGVISNTDWSYLQPTSDNRITLTTCLANQPSSRVCVQGVEVK